MMTDLGLKGSNIKRKRGRVDCFFGKQSSLVYKKRLDWKSCFLVRLQDFVASRYSNSQSTTDREQLDLCQFGDKRAFSGQIRSVPDVKNDKDNWLSKIQSCRQMSVTMHTHTQTPKWQCKTIEKKINWIKRPDFRYDLKSIKLIWSKVNKPKSILKKLNLSKLFI